MASANRLNDELAIAMHFIANGIGYDSSERILEVVAIRGNRGDWLIKHAQTPPQERVKRELGFGRRKA